MNDVREGAVCKVDGCSTQDIPSSTGAERAARRTPSLEVIWDAICPWCWVAKHRLDRKPPLVAFCDSKMTGRGGKDLSSSDHAGSSERSR
jgi:hypothetical protein